MTITWTTANVTWVVDARPDSVDYLGRKADKLAVVLATATTDANGAFSVALKAPKDFGGIHDIYAVVDGMQVAKGGFLIARTATMTPEAGPDRDDDHAHVHGLGSSLYEGGAARCYYDNKYVGRVMANWTRGVGDVSSSARPARVGNAHDRASATRSAFDYLNIQQSPIPWGPAASASSSRSRRTTAVPKQRIDWPAR